MESKKHRTNLRKRVISSALAGIVGIVAVNATTLQTQASFYGKLYELSSAYQEIAPDCVVSVNFTEYLNMLKMVMSEAGAASKEVMSGCASTAINQSISYELSMQETLDRPNAFRNGVYEFVDSEGIQREVELSDINSTIIDATNNALLGNDVTSEIGGAIGFFAPELCSEERAKYMYDHTSEGETMQIENVVFFSKWE